MSYYQPYGLMELSTFYNEEGNQLLTSEHSINHSKDSSNFNERNNLLAENRSSILPQNRTDTIPSNTRLEMENKDEQISTEIKPTQILEGKTKKGLHIIETKKRKILLQKKQTRL